MSGGIGALLCAFCALDGLKYGYKYAYGTAIHPAAKAMYEKPYSRVNIKSII